MNAVGFASTYSLIDLLDELPLPTALSLRDNERLLTEPFELQNIQELQDVAAVIAPAIQMARLPSDIDRLRFKDPAHTPAPNVRTHHSQASSLMSLMVAQHQQFQDIITVPPFQLPSQPVHQQQQAPPPPPPAKVVQPQQQQQQFAQQHQPTQFSPVRQLQQTQQYAQPTHVPQQVHAQPPQSHQAHQQIPHHQQQPQQHAPQHQQQQQIPSQVTR